MSVLGKRGHRDEFSDENAAKRGRAIYARPTPPPPPDIRVPVGTKRKADDLEQNETKRIRMLMQQQRQTLDLQTQIEMYRRQLQNAHTQYMKTQKLSRERLHMVVDAKKEVDTLRQQMLQLIQRINGLEKILKDMKQENIMLQRKYSLCSEHVRALTGHMPTHSNGRLIL